jgi:hypothetical protein
MVSQFRTEMRSLYFRIVSNRFDRRSYLLLLLSQFCAIKLLAYTRRPDAEIADQTFSTSFLPHLRHPTASFVDRFFPRALGLASAPKDTGPCRLTGRKHMQPT